MDHVMKLLSSISGGVLVYIFGTWHELFGVFIALWFIDVITGLIAAGKEGKISSYVGMVGITKKVVVFSLIAAGHLADVVLGTEDIIRNSVLTWFVINELISVVENAGRSGLPIPPKLERAIEILKSDSKKSKKKRG